jgi:anaerobic C4-dicarboxylate transporter
MVRQWGSLLFSLLFTVSCSFILRWFISIANKNLDYVGLGPNYLDKSDTFVIYIFLLFVATIVIKLTFWYFFNLRPNYVFDAIVFALFLFVGLVWLYFKSR